MKKNQDIMKIVVVGHVDHGKSTVIGRLLYDTNSLPEGTVDKVKRIAKETGKPFEYAYLLDAFEEEQKQGITIDTTQIQFQTSKRDYVIIDAPGHKEFLKNMISGAANAEAALLIIDAKEGVQEQSKRHAYILSLLGIDKIHVVLNKMDLVDYSQEVFNEVVDNMSKFLETLNMHPLSYIPVSAFYGQNILEKSSEMKWYNGKTIIDSIDSIEKEKGIEEKPLRFPIQDVYKFDDRRIIAGRIEQGTLNIGDEITIYPTGKTTTVKTIEYWAERDKKDTVFAGESVGITVADEFFNKRGEIIAFEKTAPYVTNRFRANLFWMGKNSLVKNKEYKIKLTTQEITAEIESIVKIIDSSSLDTSGANNEVKLNEVAELIIKTKEKIAYDEFKNSQSTGRFVIVDGYDVAGGGIVVSHEDSDEDDIIPAFLHNGLKGRGDIFEEFYYDTDSLTVNKQEKKVVKTYTVGDTIPTKGDSFNYPSYFDILIIRDEIAVKVRENKIEDIIPITEYEYEGYSVVNGRGFEIKAKSVDEIGKFLSDQRSLDQSELLKKWFKFGTYRKIKFR